MCSQAHSPVRHLAPFLLPANNIDDFPLCPRIARIVYIPLGQDETPALNPYRVTELLGKLEHNGLLIGELTGVEVVSFWLNDADDGLVWFEGVWRRQGLVGGGEDVSATHFGCGNWWDGGVE